MCNDPWPYTIASEYKRERETEREREREREKENERERERELEPVSDHGLDYASCVRTTTTTTTTTTATTICSKKKTERKYDTRAKHKNNVQAGTQDYLQQKKSIGRKNENERQKGRSNLERLLGKT